MNITRDNYEEYFLLYVDGELTAEQKTLVENFAATNADLQQELNMLKETVLFVDEEVTFSNKSSLYKSLDEHSINTKNYESNFLLYVDNELNETAKIAVETFVLQHPTLQNDFTLLKETKLPIETIICPNKELLYKKEERRPVVFMWAKRLAIAAAILLFTITAWLLIGSNKKVDGGSSVAVTDKKITDKKIEIPVTNPAVNPLSTGTKETNTDEEKSLQNNQQSLAVSIEKNQPAEKNSNTKKAVEPINNTTTTIVKFDKKENGNKAVIINEQQQKQQEFIAVIAPNKTDPAINATIKKQDNNNAINVKANNTDIASIAQPAIYRELNTDEEDDNKTVYIGSMEINKSKLNGLFKKAKKIFNKSKEEGSTSKESSLPNSRTLR